MIIKGEFILKLTKRKILIGAGAILLIAVAAALINFYPFLFMTPASTGKVQDTDVFVIKDAVANMYAVQLDDEYILVDLASTTPTVEKALEQGNISPENVKYILLTHSDADHVGTIGLFPNASVYMSENELPMVNGDITQGKNNSKSVLHDVGLENIILLSDNQELTIGEHKIKCISVPGHTPGSMAFVIDETYLFSGDSFKVRDNKLELSPYTRDTQLSQESISKLMVVIESTKFTFTGHYGYYESSELTVN